MLLTIEKVAVLKTIDIFAGTPDYVLASVARIVEELSLLPGESFIDEGDLGDSMYLVVEGNVRVHAATGRSSPSALARQWANWPCWTRNRALPQ